MPPPTLNYEEPDYPGRTLACAHMTAHPRR